MKLCEFRTLCWRVLRASIAVSLIVAAGCNSEPRVQHGNTIADSFVTSYLTEMKDSRFFDTTDYTYRVLSAYAKRDTNFFKKEQQQRETIARALELAQVDDSCVEPLKTREFVNDETYILMYTRDFCPTTVLLELDRSSDVYTMRYRRVQTKPNDSGCGILDDETEPLTQKNWNAFAGLIKYCDYWNMEQTERPNGVLHCGGGGLGVVGFQKTYSGPRFQSVSRPSAEGTALWKVYEFALRLSGAKNSGEQESDYRLVN